MDSERPGIWSFSPTVRSENVWISNHEFVSFPPKTVVSFLAPVGKTNLVFGKSSGNVFVVIGEAVGWQGIGNGKRMEASSGPVCDVPWRRMSVVLWAWGGAGEWMRGGGWSVAIVV